MGSQINVERNLEVNNHLLHSYQCVYTRTTGIWQTVWLEAADKKHIRMFQLFQI